MIWQTRHRRFDLTSRGVVMGILNLTPNSFSDGGRFFGSSDPGNPEVTWNPERLHAAVEHALAMDAAGAELIDIGGESTRPGSSEVPENEELARVQPVLEQLRQLKHEGRFKAEISIDTRKAAVARVALELGAGVINDITALRGDSAMASLAAETGAGVILMHMQGEPQTMQTAPHYEDVCAEVRAFFVEAARHALTAGIPGERLVFDPGPGFGKTVEHNLALLRHIGTLGPRVEELPALFEPAEVLDRPMGSPLPAGSAVPVRPMVWAVSRKAFLGKLIGDMGMEQRLIPTAAMTSLGRALGARIFRVHDVPANLQALRVAEALLENL